MLDATFDDLTPVYEVMIDWPKRLAHEGGFYRKLFDRLGARSILDAACGTGRHAALFHSWGLRVEGSDISPNMIAQAKAQFGEPANLHWVVRGFDQPVPAAGVSTPEGPASNNLLFDAVICVGNSLALAGAMMSVEGAIQRLLGAVRPGGALVVHVLNLWALPDGPCVWQKCLRTNLPQGEVLIVKGVHRCGTQGYVELIVAAPEGGKFRQTQSVPFLGLEASELEAMARRAGAGRVTFFGGYQDQPYDRGQSPDLLMVALK